LPVGRQSILLSPDGGGIVGCDGHDNLAAKLAELPWLDHHPHDSMTHRAFAK